MKTKPKLSGEFNVSMRCFVGNHAYCLTRYKAKHNCECPCHTTKRKPKGESK